jgi:Na+/phosphate symporter
MAAYLTLIIALAGLLLYALSNAKVARIGEIMFFCGLLAFCLRLANEMKRLF